MFKKVAFTMFPVKDAQRARAFYQDTLGFKLGSHSKDGVWTEYDMPGGGCLALFCDPRRKPDAQAPAPSPDGGASIAFEVEDLDALNARLKQQGVPYVADMIPSPVCRMSVIRDTEGNSIILHELKKK
jgi:catechol 2,3-dioxygenase-like lactoylglutathione lyase family enzyme